MGLDGADHCVHASHHGSEAEARFGAFEAEAIRLADLMGQLCASDQGLTWDAAIVEAITAHPVRLDESDLCFHGCGDVSADEPGGSGADHDEVAIVLLRPRPAGIST